MSLPDYRIQNVLKAYSDLVQDALNGKRRKNLTAKQPVSAGMGEISFERRTTVLENNVRDLMTKLIDAARKQLLEEDSTELNAIVPESGLGLRGALKSDKAPADRGFTFSVLDSQASCKTKTLFIEEDDLFFERIGKPIAAAQTQKS
jgi:hypothetical protein